MKPNILISILLFSNFLYSQSIKDTTKDIEKVKNGNYIPYNLYDCFYTLDIIIDSADRRNISLYTEREYTNKSYTDFGQWIYDHWQFKKASRIKKYFQSIGINTIDNMLGIILNSYYKYCQDSNKNKVNIVQHFEKYWKDIAINNRTDFPSELIKPKLKYEYIFNAPNGEPKVVNIFICKKTNYIWAYEPHFGWVKINDKILEELKDIKKDYYETFKNIFQK
jgi:hypothetical protein